tara:strand:+ start:899 stop:2584 length:1686 start_codon:yes stop_codon:yes gene_type:complete
MLINKIKYIFVIILFYQSPLLSKSITFNEINSRNVSKYFSGIVAFENDNNFEALNYFDSSKILLKQHDPYLEKFIMTLVLEGKVAKAVNILKTSGKKQNSNFFEAYILLTLDSLKRNNFEKAMEYLSNASEISKNDRFNNIIYKSLKQYVDVFKNKKISDEKEKLGNLSLIAETFQRCYLDDKNTETFFNKLINNAQTDYSRYIYFYLTYLIEKEKFEQAKSVVKDLNYINITLILSQGKSWIEKNESDKFATIFSCKNHNDIIGEFLFLISNLFSSQDDFKKSNFYLSLSQYINPKFLFNLSLVVENLFEEENYSESKKILKNFDENDDFYYWYKLKKEATMISIMGNKKDGLNFIKSKFKKFKNPNQKFLFDIANFYKNAKEYQQATNYYSLIIDTIDGDTDIKSDLLYRRGASYERLKNFKKADEDLLNSLAINPENAYVLNYLAYSWLERDYKINEAIQMLETAYDIENEDPYIIDSIGWAYYLLNDFKKAEEFIRRAVEIMPNDPIVNDHYGDILWGLNNKIQARYFWKRVLEMKDTDEELIEEIKNKLIIGPKSS